jgi:hydrogenase nickel incorporation protein HypA/HybF
MHEQSLVRSLLNQARQIAVEHGSDTVTEIEVEIGPLSGVEPSLVESAFALLQPGSCAEGGKLTIHQVPLRIRCESCELESDLQGFRFRCPACESGSVRVLRGDAFRLLSVTVEQSQPQTELPYTELPESCLTSAESDRE